MPIGDLRDDGFKLMGIYLLLGFFTGPPLISQKSNKPRKFDKVNIPQKAGNWTADLDI